MRDYIRVCEAFGFDLMSVPETEVLTEAVAPETGPSPAVLADLKNIAFKLRAFTETVSSGEHALGVEEGMLRAADMVERVIRTYWPETPID